MFALLKGLSSCLLLHLVFHYSSEPRRFVDVVGNDARRCSPRRFGAPECHEPSPASLCRRDCHDDHSVHQALFVYSCQRARSTAAF
ncbi:hypothetical protein L596_028291 [Steinernema carpocapsae]|uniref:Secreted protein n=1 Tax=Steinernema carpocapsae TaxID=34508 RepID=A0A4U5LY27_STECR|nr:hypothetical protein L596_028291 [Steinernema carpocapsae]